MTDRKKRESRPSMRQQDGTATFGTLPTPSSDTYCSTDSNDGTKPTPVRRKDGKKVGELVHDILTKEARASRHMLRRPQRAWAWDVAILREFQDLGARWTEITDLDSGQVYRAAIADFWMHGFTLDRGYGRQRALPLAYWKVRSPGEPVHAQPVQLALTFGDGR